MKSGVPQGSVMGPLLFLIYVNSLAADLGSQWVAFADDYKIYGYHPKLEGDVLSQLLQSDLETWSNRANSWNLKVNVEKCVVMRFGLASRADVGEPYSLGRRELRTVTVHRDLGVMVDVSLKFHEHIGSIVQKASGLASQLLRATICRDKDFMVSLFVSHVRPLLDYCSTVWNLGYRGDLVRLESVQRRWTKEILGMSGMSYLERLKYLGLYSVQGRLARADLIKIWKIFHAELDIGLVDVFDRHSHENTRGHCFKLAVPRCRTEIRRRFFNVRCVSLWNQLPERLVRAESLEGFKAGLDRACGEEFYRSVV